MKKAVNDDIKKLIKSNVNKICYFVKWYVDSDRSEKSYNSEIKSMTQVEYETAMNDWIEREDVQEAIKAYLNQVKNLKMFDIYNSMYDKAVKKGDVNSAKWCEQFFKYFRNMVLSDIKLSIYYLIN
ncbi:hypothetical protein D4Z93_04580 [Clostridium fermenticellae]|uniref:Uncharacterized protein n=1 Tax=Clostridium fermenticellae TaxID=2068654 RepID=A0A386H2D0_9CLOT|nr:hypothetical protein [Clostridium fermenticellae]AYD39830.1 hypothetical protein D4Z93_04580 [Clostridium fermenticellae]